MEEEEEEAGHEGKSGGRRGLAGHRGVAGLWGTREHLSVNGFCNWESVKLPNHPVRLLPLLDELIRRVRVPSNCPPTASSLHHAPPSISDSPIADFYRTILPLWL